MWHQLAVNPEIVEAVYKDEVPRLESITLRKIVFTFDRYSDVILTFDLPNFPQRPPEKWADREFNTAQMTIRLVEVLSTGLTAFGPDEIINLKIDSKQNYLMLLGGNDLISFSVKFKFLYITSLTGVYLNKVTQ